MMLLLVQGWGRGRRQRQRALGAVFACVVVLGRRRMLMRMRGGGSAPAAVGGEEGASVLFVLVCVCVQGVGWMIRMNIYKHILVRASHRFVCVCLYLIKVNKNESRIESPSHSVLSR